MNNFCRLMFALILLPLMSLGITKQSNAYQLNGKVTGLLATNDKCYVAIHDDNDKYYSDQWHLAESDAICHFAKMAYLMNISVITEVDIDSAPANVNNIQSIEISNREVTWPPYTEDNK
ncbi:hypothetical protein SODG_005778 [Sodalis praecaptivus]|uniref:hypothetical protein n=1 Tax=Sodalis praecaptivus TaxID=1239307 RepID=UPI0027E7CB83|nr:hypothetical protein [Sodalis praecaptivus]CAJ0997685.1 hypothetical protein NVIRENTERO_02965 [Sodalis praecaptivus]